MAKSFRWNEDNCWHIDRHGITPKEAEQVVNRARKPFPRSIGDDKWLVWGQTLVGSYLQVIYLEDPDLTVYVIHARPLEEREKHAFRRQER